jgi:hypothetical protein
MNNHAQLHALADFIHNDPGLLVKDPGENYAGYEHMGALLTDAMLQAGLRYETTVLPLVKKSPWDP